MRPDASPSRADSRRSPRQAAPRPAPQAPDTYRLIERQPWSLLAAPLEKAGTDPAPAILRLRRYARLLLEWNRGFSNLVSRSDEGRLVERHLLESLQPAHQLKSAGAERWLDFGSGGGLPAIPLAIAGVGETWTLVESRRNKTLFLRKAIDDLGLKGIEVRLARLETLLEENGFPSYDGFTSRATLRLGPTLALAARCLATGGHAFLWKGSGRDREMADASWDRDWARESTIEVGSGPAAVLGFVRR